MEIRKPCGSDGVEVVIDDCVYFFKSLDDLKDLLDCNADQVRRCV